MKTRQPLAQLIEPLEVRQLFAISTTLTIASVTSPTPTVVVGKPFAATVTVKNAAATPENLVTADLFLVGSGQSASADAPTAVFSLKPIYGDTSRSLTEYTTLDKITPGTYTLSAGLVDPATGVADTSKLVTGPTITFVNAPAAGSLTASLALPKSPTRLTAGTRFTPTLSLTNRTAFTTKVPVKYYLSSDRSFSSKDILIATHTFDVTFTANKATNLTKTITFPSGKPKGRYYVIAVVNPINSAPVLPYKVIAASPSTVTVK